MIQDESMDSNEFYYKWMNKWVQFYVKFDADSLKTANCTIKILNGKLN